jgi:hypothetical protein
MHQEDNALGLTVTNKKGQKYTLLGDKQLFDPKNATNRDMMRQALQASVNEVWEAYDKKTIKLPTAGYRAWDYAPAAAVPGESHQPLFKHYDTKTKFEEWFHWPVQVRTPFSNPWAGTYKPIGSSADLIKLYNNIKDSDQWKKY